MIVLYEESRRRFEALTSFLERQEPKAAGWRWAPELRRWWAPNEEIARKLARYAQGPAALRLMALDEGERRSLAMSTAGDAAIAIPSPPGLDYLPYQRAGIAYALEHRGTLIADEMGLGKTVQAVGAVNLMAETHWTNAERKRVLIVTPASLRLNWLAEWRRWHTGNIRAQLLDHWPRGLFDHWPRGLFDPASGRALIVSYDSVCKFHPMIAATEWDILIADEVHLLKDDRTRRYATICGGKRDGVQYQPILARRKLWLSGTPIVNKPAELWPLVHALDPDGMGKSKTAFINRYNPQLGPQFLDELHTRLRSRIMVRRKKEDVLKQLPAKRRQIVLLDVAGAAEIVGAEARALEAQRQAIMRAREEIDHAEQVARLRQCRAMALSEVSRIRHETALAKLPAAVEHIRDVLGNCDKAVIFLHHHDCADLLFSEFSRISVRLDGRTSEADRQRAVDSFQNDGRARLFLGSIRAAGLGLTLTAASVVIFVELDWTPAAMMQAEDRCHRIGQVNPVLAQHLVIDGSIDAKMSRILIEKQAVMDAALDGGPQTESRDILSEVLA